jgi:hypothetical protein
MAAVIWKYLKWRTIAMTKLYKYIHSQVSDSLIHTYYSFTCIQSVFLQLICITRSEHLHMSRDQTLTQDSGSCSVNHIVWPFLLSFRPRNDLFFFRYFSPGKHTSRFSVRMRQSRRKIYLKCRNFVLVSYYNTWWRQIITPRYVITCARHVNRSQTLHCFQWLQPQPQLRPQEICSLFCLL